MIDDAIGKQRAYYAATANVYNEKHVDQYDEHAKALAFFSGIASQMPHASVLDVGAGTGRALRFLKSALPSARTLGVEPVAELRAAGLMDGVLKPEQLIDGDGMRLNFENDSFDWVIETGVLHHVKNFDAVVAEMVRVAKVGVLISDSNNIGQGGLAARTMKRAIKAAGLWPTVVWAQTRGKGYKQSEGDGIYYSFSAFDCVARLRTKFPNIHYINTQDSGFDLYGSAGHVAIISYK